MPRLKSGRLSILSALQLRTLGRTQHAAVIVVTLDDRMKGFERVSHDRWLDCQP